MLKGLKEFVATCAYVGHLPGAPGTCGSVAALSAYVVAGSPSEAYGWAALAGLVVAGSWAATGARELFGDEDPRPVVIDEVAGMWTALLVLGATSWIGLVAAFVLFRLLDIAKPFPIGRLEKIGGWAGIMADDLAAGLLAGLVVRLAAGMF